MNELYWEDKLKACRTYGDVITFRREIWDWFWGNGDYDDQTSRWAIFEKFRNKTNPMIRPIKRAILEGKMASIGNSSKLSDECKTELELNWDLPYFQGAA